MARKFSSIAQATSLSAGVNSATSTMTVDALAGWPTSTPFTAVVDPDTLLEEIVTVTSVAGTTLTVVRGEDGSVPVDHTAGAEVRHKMTARDLREVHEHMDSTAAHGVSGDVVGTTDEQTLTNKTLDGGNNTFANIPQSAITDLVTALEALAQAIEDAEGDADQALSNAVNAINSALSGKANTVHTHTAAQITGDIDAFTVEGRRFYSQSSQPTGAPIGSWWAVI